MANDSEPEGVYDQQIQRHAGTDPLVPQPIGSGSGVEPRKSRR